MAGEEDLSTECRGTATATNFVDDAVRGMSGREWKTKREPRKNEDRNLRKRRMIHVNSEWKFNESEC